MVEATTDDGRKLQIHVNGTWTEVQSGNQAADSNMAEAGFRKVRWGADRATIKATEDGDPETDSPTAIGFAGRLADLDTLVAYILVDDQLVRAKYIITQEYQNKNSYIADFLTLKEALVKKYGAPAESNVFWHDDLYRDDPSEHGMAISVGDHSRFETWLTADTEICLAVTGENFDISLVVEYTSLRLRGLEAAKKESSLLSDL